MAAFDTPRFGTAARRPADAPLLVPTRGIGSGDRAPVGKSKGTICCPRNGLFALRYSFLSE
jgi:hypothetical protein